MNEKTLDDLASPANSRGFLGSSKQGSPMNHPKPIRNRMKPHPLAVLRRLRARGYAAGRIAYRNNGSFRDCESNGLTMDQHSALLVGWRFGRRDELEYARIGKLRNGANYENSW